MWAQTAVSHDNLYSGKGVNVVDSMQGCHDSRDIKDLI